MTDSARDELGGVRNRGQQAQGQSNNKTTVTQTSSSSSASSKRGGSDPLSEVAQITEQETEQALAACRDYTQELTTLEERIQKEMQCIEESEGRRRLYSELELKRLDFTDLPGVQKFLQAYAHAKSSKDPGVVNKLDATPIGSAVNSTMEKFDRLRIMMEVRRKHAMTHFRIMHMLLCIVWTVSAMPIVYALTFVSYIFKFIAARLGYHPKVELEMILQRQLARGMLASWGVTAYWEGLSNLDKVSGPTLGLFTHQSSFDVFVIASGPINYSMIGKKSLFFLPLLGQLAYLWGHTPIDRSNLDRAKQSLHRALEYVRKTGRSFGIFPEGTRSVVGRPIDFKKGAFHTAVEGGLPIIPIIVYGAGELWHAKGYMGSPGEVFVRVLPPIHIQPGETHMQLKSRVQRAVLMAYPPSVSNQVKRMGRPVFDFFWVPAVYFLCYLVKSLLF